MFTENAAPATGGSFVARGSGMVPVGIKRARQVARWAHSLVLFCGVLWGSAAIASNLSTHYSYEGKLDQARKFGALDESLFGDQVSLQDGTVVFRQVDVSVPTNSGMRVAVGRKMRPPESRLESWDRKFNVFGYGWQLDIPSMSGIYDTREGWTGGNVGEGRCSGSNFAPRERVGPWPYYYKQLVYAYMYWNGITIDIPGVGEDKLLQKSSDVAAPTDGRAYPGATRSNWRISCLPSIKNGSGEGFLVSLPDGTKYYFDWMATQNATDLTDNDSINSDGDGYDAWHLLAPLTKHYLYVSKVVDRFGNHVTYNYDVNFPNRLTSIVSSDGARVDLRYDVNTGLVSQVVAGARTWTYTYQGPSDRWYQLNAITQPDGAKWTFGWSIPPGGVQSLTEKTFWSQGCAQDPKEMTSAAGDVGVYSFTMTHPSGATGKFGFRRLFHGANDAPGGCSYFGSFDTGWWYGTYGVPSATAASSIVSKVITGPGLPGYTWRYTYQPSWSFEGQCAGSCATTSKTVVDGPDAVRRTYTYGNAYKTNYGLLLSETVEKNGVVLRSAGHAYVTSATGQPFPTAQGILPKRTTGVQSLYGNPVLFANRPRSAQTIVQAGDSFRYVVNTFDAWARPTAVTRSSSLGHSISNSTEHFDDLQLWMLGQTKRQVTGGVEVERTEFNIRSQPERVYTFGKLQQILSYHTDGTVWKITDGRNETTHLTQWKRGIPQRIVFATGDAQSAVVGDEGTIDSVTDEGGAKTCYGYDAMLRLSRVVYPSESMVGVCDGSSWYPTDIRYEQVAADEYGVPAGHWRRTEQTGSYRKLTYYDAMLRPLVDEDVDTSDMASTNRWIAKRYDHGGRVVFESYARNLFQTGWQTYAGVNNGTHTVYDGLGRVVQVSQDSEHGRLTTSTEYLPGMQVRTTNPRGYKTTQAYKAYDQPSFDVLAWSVMPEGAVLEVARNVLDKPVALKRRSADGSLSVTRHYRYDSHMQLCRVIEPETGSTVMAYDAANNLEWSASGVQLPVDDYCHHGAAAQSGRVVSRNYDSRNRLIGLYFPDSNGNQTLTYYPNGKVRDITTSNDGGANTAINAYVYNRRGLVTGEQLTQPGWYTWGVGYAYNGIGHLQGIRYPSNLYVDYNPNALGLPRSVTSNGGDTFASEISYHPNSAIKSFRYGNGIVHTMEQNARQKPLRVTSSGGVSSLEYGYDHNGNVDHIYDLNRGTAYSRWMGYDGLDRLTAAGSASFGGDHWHRFAYDALDNIRSWKLAGVKDYADYWYNPANNRLESIRNSAGAAVAGFDYDVQGNLRNKNGQAFHFDFGNRLRGVDGKEGYRYDGHGRRILAWKPGEGSILSMYAQSGQLLYEHNDRQAFAGERIYLAGSLITTRDYSWVTGKHLVKYQHTDALGSPVAVTNTSGQVVERTEWEPYGAAIAKPGYQGIGYSGHVMDGATGLTYMQQRYYDPQVGRFLSIDPITADPRSGEHFNRYSYVDNNPYRYVDPDGRRKRSSDEVDERTATLDKVTVRGARQSSSAGGGGGASASSAGSSQGSWSGNRGTSSSLPCDSVADCDFMYNTQEFLDGDISEDELLDRTQAQGAAGTAGGIVGGTAWVSPALLAALGPSGRVIGHPAYGGRTIDLLRKGIGNGKYRFGWGRDGGPVLRIGIKTRHVDLLRAKKPTP